MNNLLFIAHRTVLPKYENLPREVLASIGVAYSFSFFYCNNRLNQLSTSLSLAQASL
jgi:hypothetical protein